MTMRSKLTRGLFLLSISMLMFVSTAQKGVAYDNDTHFWLTYYLAIKTGYTPVQAAQIASATISVDLDRHTEPVLPSPNFRADVLSPLANIQYVRADLHALPLRESVITQFWVASTSKMDNSSIDPRIAADPAVLDFLAKLVAEGQDYRWTQVLTHRDNPGVFLHYLQDKYAHQGFSSAVGHAGYEYVDYLASSPSKAKLMTIDTLNYLIEFQKLMANRPVGTAKSIAENSRDLDPETLAEIDVTLARLREVNPSSGMQETNLLKQWVADDGKVRLSLLKRIYERWNDNRLPDSFKARAVVMEQLKLEEKDLPLIWYYNFRRGGFPDGRTEANGTSRIRTYRAPNIKEHLREERARNQEGRLMCLPWALVGPEVSEVPLCK